MIDISLKTEKQKVVLRGVTRVYSLKPFVEGGDKFYTGTYKRSIIQSLSHTVNNINSIEPAINNLPKGNLLSAIFNNHPFGVIFKLTMNFQQSIQN